MLIAKLFMRVSPTCPSPPDLHALCICILRSRTQGQGPTPPAPILNSFDLEGVAQLIKGVTQLCSAAACTVRGTGIVHGPPVKVTLQLRPVQTSVAARQCGYGGY